MIFIHITLHLARIKLGISKRAFYYKGVIIFKSQFLAFFSILLFLESTIYIRFSFLHYFSKSFFNLHYVLINKLINYFIGPTLIEVI